MISGLPMGGWVSELGSVHGEWGWMGIGFFTAPGTLLVPHSGPLAYGEDLAGYDEGLPRHKLAITTATQRLPTMEYVCSIYVPRLTLNTSRPTFQPPSKHQAIPKHAPPSDNNQVSSKPPPHLTQDPVTLSTIQRVHRFTLSLILCSKQPETSWNLRQPASNWQAHSA